MECTAMFVRFHVDGAMCHSWLITLSGGGGPAVPDVPSETAPAVQARHRCLAALFDPLLIMTHLTLLFALITLSGGSGLAIPAVPSEAAPAVQARHRGPGNTVFHFSVPPLIHDTLLTLSTHRTLNDHALLIMLFSHF